MTARALDVAKLMGFPWDRLAEARWRLQEAMRFGELAAAEGSDEDRKRAAWDIREAADAERRERDRLADVFQLLLRCAVEAGGTGLNTLLSRAFAASGDAAAWDRIDKLEVALAAAETRIEELELALAAAEEHAGVT